MQDTVLELEKEINYLRQNQKYDSEKLKNIMNPPTSYNSSYYKESRDLGQKEISNLKGDLIVYKQKVKQLEGYKEKVLQLEKKLEMQRSYYEKEIRELEEASIFKVKSINKPSSLNSSISINNTNNNIVNNSNRENTNIHSKNLNSNNLSNYSLSSYFKGYKNNLKENERSLSNIKINSENEVS